MEDKLWEGFCRAHFFVVGFDVASTYECYFLFEAQLTAFAIIFA